MVIADARLKTEKETAVAMPCLLRESSRNLRACATLVEASSGTPEADNERELMIENIWVAFPKESVSEVSTLARYTSPSQFKGE